MDEKYDDDVVIAESVDADINVDIYGSGVGKSISLRRATSMNFLLHLE